MTPKLATGILGLAAGLSTWLLFAANLGFEESVKVSSPAVVAAVGICYIIEEIKNKQKKLDK